jgi:hypothetical protein
MADQVSLSLSIHRTACPSPFPHSIHDSLSEQAQPRPQPGDRRPTPAEHAARLFAPEHVPAPPVVVRGPLISTPSEPTAAAAADPLPAEQTGLPATSNTLPPPSPPPETVPPGGDVPVAVVELVLDDAERTAAERWHQDRIERKLRGEYERAGKHLAEIVRPTVGFGSPAAMTDPDPFLRHRSTTTSTLRSA